MNLKNNPWVALVAALLLALILVLTLTGCGASAEAAEPETTKNQPRFIIEKASAKTLAPYQHVEIVTDTETGVQYLFFKTSSAAGLTKLEPSPEEVGS